MTGFDRFDLLTARKALSVALLVAGLTGLAAVDAWSSEKAPSSRPGSVVVVPFILNGTVDEAMTEKFVKKISSDKAGWNVVDGATVAGKLPKGHKFGSGTDVKLLRKAAGEAGAEALIIGQASRYKFMDAPSVSLRVSVLTAGDGEEVYRELTKASSWTSKGARNEAADDAAKKLIKSFKGD